MKNPRNFNTYLENKFDKMHEIVDFFGKYFNRVTDPSIDFLGIDSKNQEEVTNLVNKLLAEFNSLAESLNDDIDKIAEKDKPSPDFLKDTLGLNLGEIYNTDFEKFTCDDYKNMNAAQKDDFEFKVFKAQDESIVFWFTSDDVLFAIAKNTNRFLSKGRSDILLMNKEVSEEDIEKLKNTKVLDSFEFGQRKYNGVTYTVPYLKQYYTDNVFKLKKIQDTFLGKCLDADDLTISSFATMKAKLDVDWKKDKNNYVIIFNNISDKQKFASMNISNRERKNKPKKYEWIKNIAGRNIPYNSGLENGKYVKNVSDLEKLHNRGYKTKEDIARRISSRYSIDNTYLSDDPYQREQYIRKILFRINLLKVFDVKYLVEYQKKINEYSDTLSKMLINTHQMIIKYNNENKLAGKIEDFNKIESSIINAIKDIKRVRHKLIVFEKEIEEFKKNPTKEVSRLDNTKIKESFNNIENILNEINKQIEDIDK